MNFLRSMRPEPGPGQSGQGGAAISTPVLYCDEYTIYLEVTD